MRGANARNLPDNPFMELTTRAESAEIVKLVNPLDLRKVEDVESAEEVRIVNVLALRLRQVEAGSQVPNPLSARTA